jgi:RNA polymerase sigma-70 factor (ECF subfamily)
MQKVSNDWMDHTDDELVSLAQAGNDLAFAELVRRHRTACMKQALSILRDRSDAEDEVQNALWKAFEHLGQFNREAKFSTWLTRIVVNQCLMRLRQQKRARLLYIEDAVQSEEQITLDLRDESEGPEDVLGRAEVAGVLKQEIRRIPPLLRDVFVLREVQELPMPEVADKLGITIAAAKSRLLRARNELRARLSKHQGRLGPATLLS